MNNISETQNTKEILDALYTQRVLYQEAYGIRNVGFALVVISCILPKILESLKINNFVMIAIIVAFGLLIFILEKISDDTGILAATIQEYIDRILYGFEIQKNKIGKFFIYQIEQKIVEKTDAGKGKYIKQISNRGDEPEKGVKEWYNNVHTELTKEEAICKCQRQNTWWDRENNKYFIIYMLSLLIVILACICWWYGDKISTAITLFGEVILYAVKRSLKVISYTNISKEIETLENNVYTKGDNNLKDLENIQEKIFERRQVGYKVPDFIHNLKAIQLHKKYFKIFK